MVIKERIVGLDEAYKALLKRGKTPVERLCTIRVKPSTRTRLAKVRDEQGFDTYDMLIQHMMARYMG